MRVLSRVASVALLSLLCGACQQAVRPNLQSDATPTTEPAATIPTPAPEPIVAEPSEPAGSMAPVAGPDGTTPVVGRGADVFARINKGIGSQSCAAGSNSDLWRRRYAGNPTAFANHIQNILPLLDFVSIEVERSGLPSEFVYIPLVESWYRPEAIGSGGPAGMWQMISSTARNHGIHIQAGYDGRLSPVESTRAALSYLKTLQGMFDDWQAIVMAYNAGEGRMMRAFRRSENRTASAAQRKPHGLSNITYDYVAKLQALACLMSEPERQGLTLPVDAQFVPLAAVLMDPRIRSLDQFAASEGKNSVEIRRLNPGFKAGRVVANVPRLVLTPVGQQQAPIELSLLALVETREPSPDEMKDELAGPGSAERRASALSEARSSRASQHRVRTGESLWSIAKHYRVSIEQLRNANRLGRGSMVRPGQMLKLEP